MNSNVVLIKCPVCGESSFKKLDDTTCKCHICSSTFFITPTEISEQLNIALTYREMYKFQRSDDIYQNIMAKTSDEKIQVMCNFGRLLSYFGITYIKDFDGRYTITYSKYDPEYKSIKECTYYKHISESKYMYLYQEKLDLLDAEYKRIKDELAKTPLYDVFICTKISLRTKHNLQLKGFTEDSQYAFQFYKELKDKGLKVFYSQEVLSGIDFDAQIYSALMRSKNILVITTEKDYLESAWVQSEWRRWINFISTGVKEKNSLYLFIPNGVHLELPIVLEKTQKFNNTLELVNRMEEQISPKKQETPVVDTLLRKANTSVILGKIDAAIEMLSGLCMDYPDDYRPWIGLIDILIKQNIPCGDSKYIDYIGIAKSLCEDETKQKEISSKYDKYLVPEKKIEVVKPKETVKDSSNVFKNDDLALNKEPEKLVIKKTYNEALDLYNAKKYYEAFDAFSVLSKSGDDRAMNYLGIMYEHGRGTIQDYNQAYKWYELSANHGNSYAEYNIGLMYRYGKGVKQSNVEAVKWYKKSALQGNALGQVNYGYMLEVGLGVTKNCSEAAKWYEKSALQGNALAQSNLGNMYIYGRGVTKNYQEAFKWCKKAADQGHTSGQVNLGFLYESGYGVTRNYYEAAKLYETASLKGDAVAQSNLGNLYIYGRGVTKNYQEAYKWCKKSADQDNPSGLTNLGFLYESGYGVTRNYYEAAKLYEKAALKGKAVAQSNLGNMYIYGRGVQKNYQEAYKWCKLAADQGNTSGQINLGYLYENGFGVTKNGYEAFKWYEKAALQGDALAQSNLGYMYQSGIGVVKNEQEAFKWIQKSASAGCAAGQRRLGICYAEGRGVLKNYSMALTWLEKAANQGDTHAESWLGYMYENGMGVIKNTALAKKWYTLAANKGNQYSIDRLKSLR